jgi:hypothetical protein
MHPSIHPSIHPSLPPSIIHPSSGRNLTPKLRSVDSLYSLARLEPTRTDRQEYGYKCRAFYLKIWLEDELAHLNQCPWEEDWQYASAVVRSRLN